MSDLPSVLVLGGGPDAEREVSLASADAVAEAAASAGHPVERRTIDRVGAAELVGMPGDVVFPVLHGPWGEGGSMQAELEATGRAFVGSGSRAARLAMDKLATKLAAVLAGVCTPAAAVLNPADPACPLPFPVIVKPVHEGSSVGLMVCRSGEDWGRARGRVASGEFGPRVFMVEEMVTGREVTVGMLARGRRGELSPLPLVEIVPATGVYDYEAKYARTDTCYRVGPDDLSDRRDGLWSDAAGIAERLGIRHLCRVDFIVPESGPPRLLEVNTMPGFTASSLLPKAAAAGGAELPAVVSRLVCLAKDQQSGAG